MFWFHVWSHWELIAIKAFEVTFLIKVFRCPDHRRNATVKEEQPLNLLSLNIGYCHFLTGNEGKVTLRVLFFKANCVCGTQYNATSSTSCISTSVPM